MEANNLAGTLGTLGLMPKEGMGFTRINQEKLNELNEIGVDHQPFLDALFGTSVVSENEKGEVETERKPILSELNNTTTPFEGAQYTFGVPLSAMGTYLNELTLDVDNLSAMGKLASWERQYNTMEAMLPSLLLAMLLGGSEGGGDGGNGTPEGREPTGEEKYVREQQRCFEEHFPYMVNDILGATIDYQGLSKKMKNELREYCASPDKKYSGQTQKSKENPLDDYNTKYGYKGLYNKTGCGG